MPSLKDAAPQGATHCILIDCGIEKGGTTEMHIRWFKQEADQYRVYRTDSDNEYPEWVPLDRIYGGQHHMDWVLKRLIPLN